MRKVYYQLSEDCGEDGRAQFVSNFSHSVPLQQGTKGSFDTSQELLHIYKNKPLSPSGAQPLGYFMITYFLIRWTIAIS